MKRVVVGAKCVVGAWADFFACAPKPGESVWAYDVKNKAKTAECEFSCPHCTGSLSDFMLSKKSLMSLSDMPMKTEMLRRLPPLQGADDVIKMCEVLESEERTTKVRRDVWGATATVLQGPSGLAPAGSRRSDFRARGKDSLRNLTTKWHPSGPFAGKALLVGPCH